ncbi:carbon monoxide dehydrogenase subunit G [Terracoccus sp. 273MFTsu3.1]|uniref:SRPBCC family protein n=1 Tax=Terracoccus sp. 273MFTsu3.1 TaxID=1172188 RepID=UPI00037914EC|nr:carbon monoxide dehydrogenase subunit G [Terracoccus sp. 273MFTsu3.1]
MKITGSATLAADPQQVWDAFHDPAVLARCLPGCERLTELGPDHYAMTVTAGVAAIKGTYDGEVSLRDPQHPGSFTMKASGAGAPGTVDADVVVRLAPSSAGGTDLTYDADASVGGVIGGVGQRMLAGVTKKMAGQFFSAVDADISGVRPATPSAPTALTPSAAPGTPAGAAAPGTPVSYAGRPAATGSFAGREYALGVVTGGAVALVGVLVGWAIGRRS